MDKQTKEIHKVLLACRVVYRQVYVFKSPNYQPTKYDLENLRQLNYLCKVNPNILLNTNKLTRRQINLLISYYLSLVTKFGNDLWFSE